MLPSFSLHHGMTSLEQLQELSSILRSSLNILCAHYQDKWHLKMRFLLAHNNTIEHQADN